MTQRDRLIIKIMSLNKPTISLQTAMDIVDAIIDEGVIVPPCKVGDTVYQIDGVRIYESKIDDVIYLTAGIAFDESAIGKSIYLSRGQAEKALKEREKNG